MNPKTRLLVIAAYVAMCAIWGTTWLAIKIGLKTMPPVSGVGIRFVIAALLLYGFAALRGRLLPVRRLPFKLIAVLAATLFGINYILTYVAETHIASGFAAVLFGTFPFFTFAFGHYLVGERTTPRMWLGALLAFAGVAVISLTGAARGEFWYAAAAVAAACSAAFANVYAKRHSHVDPLVVLPPAMLLAGVVIGIAGALLEHPSGAAFGPSSLLAILYLAVFGSGIAFFLNMWVLRRIDVWIVGLSALIIPVLAVMVGIVFGGESFGVRDLAGAALVLAGVWFALAKPRVSAAAAEVRSAPAFRSPT